jgi:hypothetical protein
MQIKKQGHRWSNPVLGGARYNKDIMKENFQDIHAVPGHDALYGDLFPLPSEPQPIY